jgi:hypothetical protein
MHPEKSAAVRSQIAGKEDKVGIVQFELSDVPKLKGKHKMNTDTSSTASGSRQELPPPISASDPLFGLPPDVVQKLNEVQNLRFEGEFETKQARYLYKLGFSDAKALRHDQCGKFGRLRKCEGPKTHLTRQVMKCGYRFTKCCGPTLAKKQFEQHRKLCQFFEQRFPDKRFTFLEITKTIGRDAQSIRQFHKEVVEKIDEVIKRSDPDDELFNDKELLGIAGTPKITFFRGCDGNVATVLALVFLDVAPENWKVAFSGMTVNVHRGPMYRLSYSCRANHCLPRWTRTHLSIGLFSLFLLGRLQRIRDSF